MSAPLDLRRVLPDGWRVQIAPALLEDGEPCGMQYALDTGGSYARRYEYRFFLSQHVAAGDRAAAEAWELGRAIGAILARLREDGEGGEDGDAC